MWVNGPTSDLSYIGKSTLVAAAGVDRAIRDVALSLLAIMITLDGTQPFDLATHVATISRKTYAEVLVRYLVDIYEHLSDIPHRTPPSLVV
jgi:hypothetical protein